MSTYKSGVQIITEFSLFDASQVPVNSLGSGAFEKLLTVDGVDSAVSVVVTSVVTTQSGRYFVAFTPNAAGKWVVDVRHATHAPRGFKESFHVTADGVLSKADVNAEVDSAIADATLATAAAVAGVQSDTDALQVAVAAIPTSNPSAAAIATQVRTELGTELARVDAAVSTRATPAQVETLVEAGAAEVIAALPGEAPTANENADALLDRAGAIGGKTPREAWRKIAATTTGKSSGDPGSPVFKGFDGTTDEVAMEVDADGNRTAVDYDP